MWFDIWEGLENKIKTDSSVKRGWVMVEREVERIQRDGGTTHAPAVEYTMEDEMWAVHSTTCRCSALVLVQFGRVEEG